KVPACPRLQCLEGTSPGLSAPGKPATVGLVCRSPRAPDPGPAAAVLPARFDAVRESQIRAAATGPCCALESLQLRAHEHGRGLRGTAAMRVAPASFEDGRTVWRIEREPGDDAVPQRHLWIDGYLRRMSSEIEAVWLALALADFAAERLVVP